tara:strand:- start:2044 stop:2241 length:198 start_codon:yes stop_codon:yes gene_type:complete
MITLKVTREQLIILQDLLSQEKTKLMYNKFMSNEYLDVSNLNTTFRKELYRKEKLNRFTKYKKMV